MMTQASTGGESRPAHRTLLPGAADGAATAPVSPRVVLRSFGYLHGAPGQGWGEAPAEAHVVMDVRGHFRDPHDSPGLRQLTAADGQVRDAVLSTPGAAALAERIAGVAMAYLAGRGRGPVIIAVGCAGGRHRSAVITEHAARILSQRSVPVAVTHRDLHRPVAGRPSGQAAAPCLTAAAV
jgi:RNase adaptor protein for sRNA GlmZ degradation